ncbi:MAG: hypothetical protein H6573_35395 [Lewinellaceae bacterium]|nr:hypothetical protein [Lewinellaceae bacterium]
MIGSAVVLIASIIFWLLPEGGPEPLVAVISASVVFLGSAWSYIFYTPKFFPKLEIDIEGKNRGKSAGMDENGRDVPQPRSGVIYKYDLTWDYTFFIRNIASYPALKPKFIQREKFKGLKFPQLDKYKPIIMGWMSEMHVDKIPRLHGKDPVKSGEKYSIEAKFKKQVEATKDAVHGYITSWFPPELEDLEILLEYSNEDGERLYTLFRRNKNGELENEYLTSKPFSYTWLGSLFKRR